MLEAFKNLWHGNFLEKQFYHISTDEVYGSFGENEGLFSETSAYAPNSPYSASKASSDHLLELTARLIIYHL